MGYPGGYDKVRKFVQAFKDHQARLAYLQFETMPGLQAQVDWADFSDCRTQRQN